MIAKHDIKIVDFEPSKEADPLEESKEGEGTYDYFIVNQHGKEYYANDE